MPTYKSKEATKSGKQWYFVVSYTNLQNEYKQHKSRKYLTKREAEEAEAKYLTSKKDYIDSLTMQELCDDYIHYISSRLKETSVYKIKNRINLHILSYFKDQNVSKISKIKYRQWQDEMNEKTINGRNLSTKYKNTIHSLFVSIINHGMSYKNLEYNVATLVGRFKDKGTLKKEIQFISYDQFNKLIETIEKETDEKIRLQYLAVFSILYYFGVRKGEMQALTCEDIEQYLKTYKITINKTVTLNLNKKGYIITTPKTKSSIRVIKPPLKAYIHILNWYNHLKLYKNFSKEWFFIGGIEPIPDTTLARVKNKYFKLADLKQIKIHDFRHSCASHVISKGVDIANVAKYLGHSSLSTTLDFYTHAFQKEDDTIANIFDNS